MDGQNQNTNNGADGAQNKNAGNSNQQTQNQGQNTNSNQQQQNQQTQDVDVKAAQAEAVQNLLKGLGVQDEESLKNMIGEYNKQKESQMTDVEKKAAEITKLTQELVEERERRILAEAKIEGIKLGANKDLIDDLVVIAKSKVTKDKDISTVMSEMKEGNTVYFKTEETQQTQGAGKAKSKNVTAGKTGGEKNKEDGKDNGDAFMDRILKKKSKPKSNYFK